MTKNSLHLNLLKDNEVLSASPVRLRVMIPLLALLACFGMAVWWGTIFTQTLMVRSSVTAREQEIAAKEGENAAVLKQMEDVRELTSHLEQLSAYAAGVRHVASNLVTLAEVIPVRVQLTELSITPPDPQNLANPVKGRPPLWGPTTNVETQNFLIAGRALRETPVQSLITSLEDDAFKSLVTPQRKIQSEYRKDRGREAKRYLNFELLYTMPERRFAP